MQPLPREVCREIESTSEQRLAKQSIAVSRNDHFNEVFEPRSLPQTHSYMYSLPSFTLPTLCCTWPTVPKACATPTNSNVCIRARHTLQIRTPSFKQHIVQVA